jgi:hypothetical protein
LRLILLEQQHLHRLILLRQELVVHQPLGLLQLQLLHLWQYRLLVPLLNHQYLLE